MMSENTRNVLIPKLAAYFATQPVEKAWLFGSFARGEETPESDVDVLVTFDDKANVSLFKHISMQIDLEKMTECPVDLVTDGTLLPFAIESVNYDKRLIYERTTTRYCDYQRDINY